MADAVKPMASATAVPFSLALSAYTGRYCNTEWGTVGVTAKASALHLQMGVLNAAAVVDGTNTVRAELIPGQRSKMSFVIDGQSVTALTAFGAEFRRC